MSKTNKDKKRSESNAATSISMTKEMLKAARHVCVEDERTISEYVRLLIRRDLIARGLLSKYHEKGT